MALVYACGNPDCPNPRLPDELWCPECQGDDDAEAWAATRWHPTLPFPPAPIVCTCDFSMRQWECRCDAFAAEQAAKKAK